MSDRVIAKQTNNLKAKSLKIMKIMMIITITTLSRMLSNEKHHGNVFILLNGV